MRQQGIGVFSKTERRSNPNTRVHNHRPWRPMCNERLVDGQLRGACLNDDGTDR